MKRVIFSTLLSAAVLAVTGCSTSSGPTFNAYSVDMANGVQIYKVECGGLLESAATCMKVAERICGDKAVRPIEKADRVRAADDNRRDPRSMLFACGTNAVSNPPAAKPEPADKTVESFTLQSDALFPFDKSSTESMLPAGKAELDRIAKRIRQHDGVTGIDVVGHADRLGPASINGPLSIARANTVRGYLIERGLDGNLIRATGVGSREPRSNCPEGGESRELIACLQPDRYVSITVQGRK